MVRTCAEHQPEDFPAADLDKPPIVRTTLPSVLEKWLIYGINFNYHLEHHLWPHVPFFNLPKLHAHLAERGFYEQRPDLLQHTLSESSFDLPALAA
jgi:fatty acid desaturase